MKVILLQDVAKLGQRYEIVDVPSGHARNKLIPQGLAQEATQQNVQNIKARAERAAAERAATQETFTDALEKAANTTVTITAGANEQGSLFEALKAETIVAALNAEGLSFTESQMQIATPIKETGTHTIAVQEGDMTGEITINVSANT